MPIYRYQCNTCGMIQEKRRSLSEGAPENYHCKASVTKLNMQPEAWIDEPATETAIPHEIILCNGTMERKYDSFQFHISGR